MVLADEQCFDTRYFQSPEDEGANSACGRDVVKQPVSEFKPSSHVATSFYFIKKRYDCAENECKLRGLQGFHG